MTEAVFQDLIAGQYIVYVYHDINDNEMLETNGLFGKPSEPYGFSNNPSVFFGPPKFRKCIFELKEDKEIEIILK